MRVKNRENHVNNMATSQAVGPRVSESEGKSTTREREKGEGK